MFTLRTVDSRPRSPASMASKQPEKDGAPPLTTANGFEALYGRLEEAVTKLEQGGLTLEESLTLYEEGIRLSRLCHAKLEEAEGKTGNISGNGVFFVVSARLGPDTPITFSVQFPSEIAKASIELVGQGRVVRQSRPGEPSGVAAIIDDYQLVPMSAA